MFDKENTGEITIKDVYEMLNEFDKREKTDTWGTDEQKVEEVKEPAPKKTAGRDVKVT